MKLPLCTLLALCAAFSEASPRLGPSYDHQYPADTAPLGPVFNSGRLTPPKANSVRTLGLTPDEVTTILNKHNEYRGDVSPTAANMRVLQWDSALASDAQSWADQCTFSHDSANDRLTGGWWYVGQNIAYGYGNALVDYMNLWNGEKADYNFDANTCTNVCGHYTQIAWAETEFIGCGWATCPSQWGPAWPFDYLVCNYGPGGNVNGLRPYTSGPSCSGCPAGYSGGCDANLCKLG